MEVPSELQKHLNSVLKAGNDLHRACVGGQDIDGSLTILIRSLNEARRPTHLLGLQKTHIDRILIACENSATQAQKMRGEKKVEALKRTFTDLVQIEQEFQLDKYNIFFCGSDQSVWLQKDRKPLNPIHPRELRSCGKQVQ